jgi:hypothetical protein
MSIIIPGILTIKSIQGARGAFSVGDLQTDVGEFRIKDALLDEYEPGQYTGRFVISNIFPSSYTWRGRVSVEVRAHLQEILLDEADVGSAAASQSESAAGLEPDPLDEEVVRKAPLQNAPDVPAAVAQSDAASIFGQDVQAMIDAGEAVKLDPTVDRTTFRQQRDALKAMGYRFDPAAQSWSK